MENECIVCGDEVLPQRWKAGFRACFQCREKKAQEIKKAKAKQNAPAYNKGPYMVLTSRQMVLDIGR
jgi:hypothetical protein